MRPLAVESGHERVEAGLLLEHVGDRRFHGLAFQCRTHPLMLPVLLGMAGRDPLERDAQAQPSDGEFAEPVARGPFSQLKAGLSRLPAADDA